MTEAERYLKRKAAGYWKSLPESAMNKRRATSAAYRAKNREKINATRRKPAKPKPDPIQQISKPKVEINEKTKAIWGRFLAWRKGKQND